ncbi:hypothetical protein GC209_11760 [bacterium]|nr:hypothetical protein [bacterium]
MAEPKDHGMAEARVIAVVIAGAMILWMGFQTLSWQLQWPPKYVFLADLSAGAAFLWAMVATYRLWRKRQA